MSVPSMELEELKQFISACVEKCCAESRTAQLVVQQALAEAKKEHLTLLKDLRDCVVQHAGIINDHDKRIDIITVTVNSIGQDVRKGQDVISSLVEDFLNTSNMRFKEMTEEFEALKSKLRSVESQVPEYLNREKELMAEIDNRLQQQSSHSDHHLHDFNTIFCRLQEIDNKIAEQESRKVEWEMAMVQDIERRMHHQLSSEMLQELENTISMKLHQLEGKIQERDDRHVDREIEILNEVDIKLQQSNIMEFTQELCALDEKFHQLESTVTSNRLLHQQSTQDITGLAEKFHQLESSAASNRFLHQQMTQEITGLAERLHQLDNTVTSVRFLHQQVTQEFSTLSERFYRLENTISEREAKHSDWEMSFHSTPVPAAMTNSITHNLQKSIMDLRSVLNVKENARTPDRRELSTESIPPPPPSRPAPSTTTPSKRRVSPRNKSA